METINISARMVEVEDWDFYFVDGTKLMVTVDIDKGDKVEPLIGTGLIAITYRDAETRAVIEGSMIIMSNLLYYSKRGRKIPYVDPKDTPVEKELRRLREVQDAKLGIARVVKES